MAGALTEALHRTGALVDLMAAGDPAHAPALARKPAAFVSVCLGVLQHDPKVRRDLQAIVDRFIAVTGWRPAVVKFVAGALPYTRNG